jgi:Clathrin light chain
MKPPPVTIRHWWFRTNPLPCKSRERALKREATGAKNREDEQATMEAIEADLENDNSWQRVCKLVELQAETTDKSQDVKRMRDVMIFLKNEPTKAVALST